MSPAASDSDFDEDEDPDKIEVPGNLFILWFLVLSLPVFTFKFIVVIFYSYQIQGWEFFYGLNLKMQH